MNHDNDNVPESHILMGAEAIAEFLNVTPRQVYRLVSDRIIPSWKSGGTVTARKTSLLRWMAEQESAARAAA